MRLRSILLVAGASLAGSASLASAQGSLSSLGFGYPVGGMSTRVSGTAGAFGEFDALSPFNPASLGGVTRTVISVQTEPEFRTLRLNGVSEKTTSQRIPLLSVIFPARRNIAVGLSASSFLDRSYSTVTTGAAVIDGVTLPTTDHLDIRGAIANLRAAVGWQVNERFRVGVAGHLFTGDNVAARDRRFADTLAFGSVLDSSRVIYFGTGLSVGGEMRVVRGLAASLSYRIGNGIDARIRDTVRTKGNVPNRLAGALRYDGIPGSVFAVGFEQVDWSRMASLGSDLITTRDAMNWHIGAEVAGPKLRNSAMLVRAGFARNELPFSTSSQAVSETRFSAGLGVPIAREAASLDFSIQRANRSLQGGGAKESAWLLGVGLQIRP
jgi:hypothetical protein